jgi:hypothetical protein
MDVLGPRIVIAAFDGWNDAGEAASAAIEALRSSSEYDLVHSVDPELYFDYQYTRRRPGWMRRVVASSPGPRRDSGDLATPDPVPSSGCSPAQNQRAPGKPSPRSSSISLYETTSPDSSPWGRCCPMSRTRDRSRSSPPARTSRSVRRTISSARSMRARSESSASSSTSPRTRASPRRASGRASPTTSLQRRPSPKVTLALLDRLEELTGLDVDRQALRTEAAAWEASIDAAASEDEDMAEYIRQLERTRDTWDSPEASGDAIAQAFERYLRRRDDGPGDRKR